MSIRSLAAAVVLFSAASSLTSCANLTLKQDLQPQLTEVQILREDLQSEWAEIDGLVTGIEDDIRLFASHQIDTNTFNSPVVIDGIVNAIDARIVAGDGAGAVVAATTQAGASLEGLSAETRDLADALKRSGVRIVDKLQVEIPATMASALDSAVEIAAQVVQIKTTSEKKVSLGRSNPLMTEEDKSALESEYETLESELAQIEALADQATRDAKSYTARLETAFDEFRVQLAAIKSLND